MLHPAPIIDALLSLALGALLGLVYDLLRPPRRAMRALGILADLAFCLLAALGAFSLAMADADGRFGLWAVAAGFAGFLLWLALVSPLFAPLAQKSWTRVAHLARICEKIAKKTAKSANSLYAKLKSCFIINSRSIGSERGGPQ